MNQEEYVSADTGKICYWRISKTSEPLKVSFTYNNFNMHFSYGHKYYYDQIFISLQEIFYLLPSLEWLAQFADVGDPPR
jgi:hypothetical protein